MLSHNTNSYLWDLNLFFVIFAGFFLSCDDKIRCVRSVLQWAGKTICVCAYVRAARACVRRLLQF